MKSDVYGIRVSYGSMVWTKGRAILDAVRDGEPTDGWCRCLISAPKKEGRIVGQASS
jgi:hypothetical protein